jgi:hypothetical protein
MINPKGKEIISITMVLPMKENGMKISSMDSESKNGLTELNMKENTKLAKRRAKESFIGLMDQSS